MKVIDNHPKWVYNLPKSVKMGDYCEVVSMDKEKEKILNEYYCNDGKKIKKIVDKILRKFGGIYQKDYDDFYSIANREFMNILNKYDGKHDFEGLLYSCLSNKIKSEITRKNRIKRTADREAASIDTMLGESDNFKIEDTLKSNFNLENEVSDKIGLLLSEKMEKYLSSLSNNAREILTLKSRGFNVKETKQMLKLSDKQYERYYKEIKSFEKIQILLKDKSKTRVNEINIEIKEDLKMQEITTPQTLEKWKPDKLSIASIVKKMDKYEILFNHPLQRESDQWSPAMKGNLISDILQGNPLPELVFAEQVVNGLSIIWDLDGKQRCTNVYAYINNLFKVTKKVKRPIIAYQSVVKDENGNYILDDNGFPQSKRKEFDIRGKKYSELPEELQDKFNDYCFQIVQYINCSSEDIAYHIARYNEGKPMTASQKGLTRLGEEFALKVKSISNMAFFRDCGDYKASEFRNGTINRVVLESIMTAHFIDSWKKGLNDMCDFIRDNATSDQFDELEDSIDRITTIFSEDVTEMFTSKDSFLWFGLFSRFSTLEVEDHKFIDFMAAFKNDLHSKEINGVSYDELNEKSSTKDKNIVLNKMKCLEDLMLDYFNINKEDITTNEEINIVDFIKENTGIDVTDEDVEVYEDVFNELTLNVDNSSKLMDKVNRPSFIALVAYSFNEDVDLDSWIVDFFNCNNTYISNQAENYLYMKKDVERYFKIS